MLSSNHRQAVAHNPPMSPAKPSSSTALAIPPAVPDTGSFVGQVASSDQYNPFRKFAFYFGIAMVFIRFSVLLEVIYVITQTSTYLLYFVVPPAALGAVLTGGLGRLFRHRAAYLWIGFFAWMILATPFSVWPGGSAQRVLSYGRVDLVIILVTGGLAVNWKEIRVLLYTIAAAAVVNLGSARFLADNPAGRIGLKWGGLIANSNDLAAHLLLVLPFLLYVTMDRKRNAFVRLASIGMFGYGVWVILGTGSRGGLLATGVAYLFAFARISMRLRLIATFAAVVIALGAMATMPKTTLDRLAALWGEEHLEAQDSYMARSYLFTQSVRFTLQNPVFGVGPDQFTTYESRWSNQQGQRGSWHATHCAYTQVSSECGIPALLFFLGSLGSAWLLVNRAYRMAKQKGYEEIKNACFCYLLAMVGFLTAIIFLANAYSFHLPAMVGLGVCLGLTAMREIETSDANKPAPDVWPMPLQGRT